jgi:hypothetical protein
MAPRYYYDRDGRYRGKASDVHPSVRAAGILAVVGFCGIMVVSWIEAHPWQAAMVLFALILSAAVWRIVCATEAKRPFRVWLIVAAISVVGTLVSTVFAAESDSTNATNGASKQQASQL